jgi:hypothetical protein
MVNLYPRLETPLVRPSLSHPLVNRFWSYVVMEVEVAAHLSVAYLVRQIDEICYSDSIDSEVLYPIA